MISASQIVRDAVLRIAPYNAGLTLEEVRQRFSPVRIAKLGSNENPLGASPGALHSLNDFAALLGRYPDPAGNALCEALARELDLPAGCIVLGNGSEDLIGVLARAVLRPGDRMVTLYPSFPLHEDYSILMSAEVRRVPVRPDLSIDIEGLLREIAARPRMVMFSSPMNPVGAWLSADEMRAVVEATADDTLLVVDEAYAEYADETLCPTALNFLRRRHGPWVILRTFSKAYGLAGLRIGFGVTGSADLASLLHRVRTPFNANAVAQRAATAALKDTEHLRLTVELARSERERMLKKLRALGYAVRPSQGNFLFIDVGHPSADAAEELLKAGVIVKPWRQAEFNTFLRVSIGARDDNDQFLDALGINSSTRP